MVEVLFCWRWLGWWCDRTTGCQVSVADTSYRTPPGTWRRQLVRSTFLMHKARLTRWGLGRCRFWLQIIGACLSRFIVAAARLMRLLMSARLCPSDGCRLPRYIKSSTDSTSLSLMDIFSGGGPAPRFCSFVLAHIRRPRGVTASLKLSRRVSK